MKPTDHENETNRHSSGSSLESKATLKVHPANGASFGIPVIVRIDTPVEKDYYRAGGILPYVLAQILE